jgi:hypothetical protein
MVVTVVSVRMLECDKDPISGTAANGGGGKG